ncbi:MAG: hypothetical protein RQ736_04685 [Thiogranum sp.]|nr:hypothetical protein [Thiogranum sp.]
MNESGLIYRSLCLVASFVLVCGSALASTAEGVMEETGLRYWEWQDDGILFRLTQRLPDQTRAFFLARGFDRADVDFIATQCVFQSMFKNTGALDGEVAINLEKWEVRTGQGQSALMTRENWRDASQLQDAPAAAMIALEWSLLPTHQTYAPNDYNWGMTSYGLPPGSTFDLEFSWSREDRRFSRVLSGVECPADIHPQPE